MLNKSYFAVFFSTLAIGCSGDGDQQGSGGAMAGPQASGGFFSGNVPPGSGQPSEGGTSGVGGGTAAGGSSASSGGTASGDGGSSSGGTASGDGGSSSGGSSGGSSDVPDIPECAAVADWPDHLVQLEEELFALVNQARTSGYDCGGKQYDPMPALEWDPLLRCAARLHAKDMVANDYYSHGRWTASSNKCSNDGNCNGSNMICRTTWFHDASSPSRRTDGEKFCGLSPTGRLAELGGSGRVGENNNLTTTATAQHLMNLWKESSGHCKNFMTKSYDKTGLGIADGGIFNWSGTVTVSQKFQ